MNRNGYQELPDWQLVEVHPLPDNDNGPYMSWVFWTPPLTRRRTCDVVEALPLINDDNISGLAFKVVRAFGKARVVGCVQFRDAKYKAEAAVIIGPFAYEPAVDSRHFLDLMISDVDYRRGFTG